MEIDREKFYSLSIKKKDNYIGFMKEILTKIKRTENDKSTKETPLQ